LRPYRNICRFLCAKPQAAESLRRNESAEKRPASSGCREGADGVSRSPFTGTIEASARLSFIHYTPRCKVIHFEPKITGESLDVGTSLTCFALLSYIEAVNFAKFVWQESALILGVGIDLVPVSRFAGLEPGDLDASFTPGEIAYCLTKRYPARHLAARFAAKEAYLKALGSGARTPGEFLLVEVTLDEPGAPSLVASEGIARRAELRGVTAAHLSLTHTGDMAAAVVILEG